MCQTDPGVVGAFHVTSIYECLTVNCQTDPGVVGAFHVTSVYECLNCVPN